MCLKQLSDLEKLRSDCDFISNCVQRKPEGKILKLERLEIGEQINKIVEATKDIINQMKDSLAIIHDSFTSGNLKDKFEIPDLKELTDKLSDVANKLLINFDRLSYPELFE
eukprot:TRINITY_DN5632_c0_g1_i1.p1 TRINITY_DN5632_c0_g1~~TRINITY_DN5632_c0_g1_i1.p1  ORF type:complete len:111 (-),score=22.74 TRINITY_DN5632_c0_g1_i1:135-467(-)